jgi:hypothetical protein
MKDRGHSEDLDVDWIILKCSLIVRIIYIDWIHLAQDRNQYGNHMTTALAVKLLVSEQLLASQELINFVELVN